MFPLADVTLDKVSSCDGIMLVYSITSKESFDYVRNLREELFQLKYTKPMILVGTKSDLDSMRSHRS
jgi:GTPase SAR1 family protein